MTGELDFTQYDDLNIYNIAVPVRPVQPEIGPVKLLSALSSHSVLPVVDERSKELVKILHDVDILKSSSALSSNDGQREQKPLLTLDEDARIQDARFLFENTQQPLIPIVDEKNRYSGYCASRRELIRLMQGSFRPPRIGGLATPLGVYMTSGVYTSGAGLLGLLVTGATFAILLRIVEGFYLASFSAVATVLPTLTRLNEAENVALQMVTMFLILLMLLRLTPLSGLHAAEHMTINAIENGLEITEQNVRTQPREHIRCGTNLMVLFVGIQLGWISQEIMRSYLSPAGSFLYLLLWIALVSRFWKDIGLWIQTHFTTKPPTTPQLESGMKAGRELLKKYAESPHQTPGMIRRIWGAGIVQMILSFALTNWVISMVLDLFYKLT